MSKPYIKRNSAEVITLFNRLNPIEDTTEAEKSDNTVNGTYPMQRTH